MSEEKKEKEFNFNVTFYLKNGVVIHKNTVLEESKIKEFRQNLISTFVEGNNLWFLFLDSGENDDQSIIKIEEVSAIDFESIPCKEGF